MNVTFKRTATTAYLVLGEDYTKAGALSTMSYDRRMMLENEIPGLLKTETMVVNSEREYLYDITRLQSVAFLCEQGALDFETLRTIVDGMARLTDELERYLLKPDKVIYNPEYVFLDLFQNKARLMYDIRSERRGNTGSQAELLAYLLTKIDHSDMELVNYMYELYEAAVKIDFSIRDWVEAYYSRRQEQRIQMAQEILPEVTKERDKSADYAENASPTRYQRNDSPIKLGIDPLAGDSWEDFGQEEENSLLNRVLTSVKERFGRFRRQEKEEEDTFYFNPMSEPMPVMQETILLPQAVAEEAFMEPIQFGDSPIHLAKENRIIGKENYADIVLPDYTVSRMHALIKYNKNDGYSIEDLNSTNGTFVNGKMLQLKQKVPLHDGDRIMIGRVEYAFSEARA